MTVEELERDMKEKRKCLTDLRALQMELRTTIDDAEEDHRQAMHAYNVAMHRNRRDNIEPCLTTTSS